MKSYIYMWNSYIFSHFLLLQFSFCWCLLDSKFGFGSKWDVWMCLKFNLLKFEVFQVWLFDKKSTSQFCWNLAKFEKLSIDMTWNITYWWGMLAHISPRLSGPRLLGSLQYQDHRVRISWITGIFEKISIIWIFLVMHISIIF